MGLSSDTSTVVSETIAGALDALRDRAPLVQCLTNIVVVNYTANVLLAAGASPAMVDNPAEAGPFGGIAGGVLVNLGTPYPDTAEAMAAAVDGASSAGTPWVLDPVAAGVLQWRTTIAHELAGRYTPTIVRGNASEVIALAGGAGGRGVDSVHTAEHAVDHAAALAAEWGTVVAVSGEVDHITDGERLIRVGNGHPWLTQVTGSGCALGALMAGFAAVEVDGLLAAAAATAVFTVAADRAAEGSSGPGTFAVALLDSLASLSADTLRESVRLT